METTQHSAPRHVMAVLGGAVSGAEAAVTLAEKGIEVVVFEQNARPYGKIEDGLPRWHDKQRATEYARINSKLNRPLVHYVPLTKLGTDVQFRELLEDWGFSAILMATGAWRDRPMPVEGIDQYVGKGLIYQNSLVYWFNHHEEKGYDGIQYDAVDDAMVVGGGLASYDVVKILMLETVGKKLAERGEAMDIVEMEHRGIDKVLAEKKLTLQDLGLQGCTLYYRRRALDMPVLSYKPGADEASRRKTEEVRERVLENTMRKFLFRFQPTHAPIGEIVEDGRLVGVRFIRTEIKDGRVHKLPGTEVEYRSPMIVSSIGSVPEVIPGIPMDGEFYKFTEDEAARLEGHENVFGVGNVVTGKGNIAVSRKHGAAVADFVSREYMGLDGQPLDEADTRFGRSESRLHEAAEKVGEAVQSRPPISAEQRESILKRVKEQQTRVGFGGDYAAWIEKTLGE